MNMKKGWMRSQKCMPCQSTCWNWRARGPSTGFAKKYVRAKPLPTMQIMVKPRKASRLIRRPLVAFECVAAVVAAATSKRCAGASSVAIWRNCTLIDSTMRYAAVGIGSNSLRMLAAEGVHGETPRELAADREVTRLGEGVFRDGVISLRSMEDVLLVLTRMAATYRALDIAGVRAVATSAVRDASNQQEFLARASEALGTPVEIISGREEARLIHRGVLSRWPQKVRRVLITDIGGGSAEIISSDDGRLVEAISKPLGALRLTEMFLHADPPARRELHQLTAFVDAKLDTFGERMGGKGGRVIATAAPAAAGGGPANRCARSR